MDATIDANPDEALRREGLEHFGVLALTVADHRREQRGGGTFGEAHHWSTIWLTVLRGQVDEVIGAAGNTGAREEQAQVVVDLGDGADGGPGVVGGLAFCSMAIAGDSPSMLSTSGFSIIDRNCRA